MDVERQLKAWTEKRGRLSGKAPFASFISLEFLVQDLSHFSNIKLLTVRLLADVTNACNQIRIFVYLSCCSHVTVCWKRRFFYIELRVYGRGKLVSFCDIYQRSAYICHSRTICVRECVTHFVTKYPSEFLIVLRFVVLIIMMKISDITRSLRCLSIHSICISVVGTCLGGRSDMMANQTQNCRHILVTKKHKCWTLGNSFLFATLWLLHTIFYYPNELW